MQFVKESQLTNQINVAMIYKKTHGVIVIIRLMEHPLLVLINHLLLSLLSSSEESDWRDLGMSRDFKALSSDLSLEVRVRFVFFFRSLERLLDRVRLFTGEQTTENDSNTLQKALKLIVTTVQN